MNVHTSSCLAPAILVLP